MVTKENAMCIVCLSVESVRSSDHLSDTLKTHKSIDQNKHTFIIQF